MYTRTSFPRLPQKKMNDTNMAGLRLDAARRVYYKKTQKHLKQNVMVSDNSGKAMPTEDDDPALKSAPFFALQQGEALNQMGLASFISIASNMNRAFTLQESLYTTREPVLCTKHVGSATPADGDAPFNSGR